jgi:hypothetical protein
MKKLLDRLNYKGNERIAVLNPYPEFLSSLATELSNVKIDSEIDPRFPYDFMMIFAGNAAEVDMYTPLALHNLLCDGTLWFCYPKKSSKKHHSDIDRDHGWKMLNDAGFHGIRLVAINDEWTAIRFRSIKFIKSSSDRFSK